MSRPPQYNFIQKATFFSIFGIFLAKCRQNARVNAISRKNRAKTRDILKFSSDKAGPEALFKTSKRRKTRVSGASRVFPGVTLGAAERLPGHGPGPETSERKRKKKNEKQRNCKREKKEKQKQKKTTSLYIQTPDRPALQATSNTNTITITAFLFFPQTAIACRRSYLSC